MSTAETAVNTTDIERPWPGLLSFGEDAAELFHGRATEVQELVRLLSHETVSFLYGKSGLGKTSLLQAGLFPRLRATDRLPVYVRLSYDSAALPAKQQIFNALIAALDQAGVEGERPNATDSAWAYLHRRDFEWWSPRNKPVLPVFVFDQFEELFTIGQESGESRALATEVADLLMELTTHRPGAELRREFETHPDLVESFNYDATNYQLLFAFREDFLPQFDQLRERLRINPHNRLALARLNGQNATESILGTGGNLVTPAVAEDIVRFVAGERDSHRDEKSLKLLEVEPWLLSLVCQQVNEQRLAASPPQSQISSALLTGTRDLILAQYYASCIAGFDARVPAFLEDRLLTESGFRNTYPYDEAIHVDGITARVIDTLVDRRLLRKEQHMGVQRVEISHDVLGPVLVRYREQRMQQEADAIAVVRDISNKQRISEGRRRSGWFVVLATAALAILMSAFILRDREITRATQTARWARELQTMNFALFLKAVETKPVSADIQQRLQNSLSATYLLRQQFPHNTQLASQQMQLSYLASTAIDSGASDIRKFGLLLSDSLPTLPIASADDAYDLELAYEVASQLAEQAGDSVRMFTLLRRHAALVTDTLLSDFARARAIGAARQLAIRSTTAEEKAAALELAIRNWSPERMSGFAVFRDEPTRIGALANQIADREVTKQNSDPKIVRRLLEVARLSYSFRLTALRARYKDSSNVVIRDSVADAYGALAWSELLTRDFELSKQHSEQALQLAPSKIWIRQNQLHARLFLGEWESMVPELARLQNVPMDLPPAGRLFGAVALQDIREFRKYGLQHADIGRYEQFFRQGRR